MVSSILINPNPRDFNPSLCDDARTVVAIIPRGNGSLFTRE